MLAVNGLSSHGQLLWRLRIHATPNRPRIPDIRITPHLPKLGTGAGTDGVTTGVYVGLTVAEQPVLVEHSPPTPGVKVAVLSSDAFPVTVPFKVKTSEDPPGRSNSVPGIAGFGQTAEPDAVAQLQTGFTIPAGVGSDSVKPVALTVHSFVNVMSYWATSS